LHSICPCADDKLNELVRPGEVQKAINKHKSETVYTFPGGDLELEKIDKSINFSQFKIRLVYGQGIILEGTLDNGEEYKKSLIYSQHSSAEVLFKGSEISDILRFIKRYSYFGSSFTELRTDKNESSQNSINLQAINKIKRLPHPTGINAEGVFHANTINYLMGIDKYSYSTYQISIKGSDNHLELIVSNSINKEQFLNLIMTIDSRLSEYGLTKFDTLIVENSSALSSYRSNNDFVTDTIGRPGEERNILTFTIKSSKDDETYFKAEQSLVRNQVLKNKLLKSADVIDVQFPRDTIDGFNFPVYGDVATITLRGNSANELAIIVDHAALVDIMHSQKMTDPIEFVAVIKERLEVYESKESQLLKGIYVTAHILENENGEYTLARVAKPIFGRSDTIEFFVNREQGQNSILSLHTFDHEMGHIFEEKIFEKLHDLGIRNPQEYFNSYANEIPYNVNFSEIFGELFSVALYLNRKELGEEIDNQAMQEFISRGLITSDGKVPDKIKEPVEKIREALKKIN
jgi:hypothetical protein